MFKILTVCDHGITHVVHGQNLLLLLELRPLRDSFHINVHRFRHFLHALLSELHLSLESLELISCVRLHLATHPFVRPLSQSI